MEMQLTSSVLSWLVGSLACVFGMLLWCGYNNRTVIKQLQQKVTHLNVEIKRLNHNLNILLQGRAEVAPGEEDIDETKLYIGNIDYAASEDDLAAHFARFGQIATVNIPLDRYSGRPRGFGFITFKRVADAIKAMDLDGSEFKGRQIQVNFARERASA